MELLPGTTRIKERVKLLAYEDTVLQRPVLIDLVFADRADDLPGLADRLDLVDLIHAIREAARKLPEKRESLDLPGAAEEGVAAAGDDLTFELPDELRTKRFILPPLVKKSLKNEFLDKQKNPSLELKPTLFGHGEGASFWRMGLLGLARNQEQGGASELPFYYATLLAVIHQGARLIHEEIADDGKLKELYDQLRARLLHPSVELSEMRQGGTAARLLENPFTPYALRRARNQNTAFLPAEKVVQRYVAFKNQYGLTPSLVQALDAHFGGEDSRISDDPRAYAELSGRVRDAMEQCGQATEFAAKQARVQFWVNLAAVLGFAAFFGGTLLPWLMSPLDAGAMLQKSRAPEFLLRLRQGLLFGVLAGVYLFAGGMLFRLLNWRNYGSLIAGFNRLRRELYASGPFEPALAQALAYRELMDELAREGKEYLYSTLEDLKNVIHLWKNAPGRIVSLLGQALSARRVSRRALRLELPGFLKSYLRLKNHELEYKKLAQTTIPVVDYADLYTEEQLRELWSQNSCVCYEGFPSLIKGESKKGAVYFIDVIGSTEISTKTNLSNALQGYSRLLQRVNETQGVPLWRKEMGDGRIYCYPLPEALRRSVLSVQGSAHPKVGLQIGIGLSLGEIYTDVMTGDFLNEMTNRASRLNSRDETVGAWVRAKYIEQPFRVHVKYGRLYNTGIAVDEKTLRAVGLTEWYAPDVTAPFEWHFPIAGEDGGPATPGHGAYYVERLDPAELAERMISLGASKDFERVLRRLDEVVAFEVFCYKSDTRLRYRTALEGAPLKDFLAREGVTGALFRSGEFVEEVPVTHIQAELPGDQTYTFYMKRQKAYLKGLGETAVAEVDISKSIASREWMELREFLSSL